MDSVEDLLSENKDKRLKLKNFINVLTNHRKSSQYLKDDQNLLSKNTKPI